MSVTTELEFPGFPGPGRCSGRHHAAAAVPAASFLALVHRFERRPLLLIVIDAGYVVVTMTAMSVLHGSL